VISDLHAAIRDGRRYGCIYVDPPWVYDNQATRASTSNHYAGMTIEQLCELPVGELAAADCHLHLWITIAFLFEVPRLLSAWGYEFKSTFVWIKPEMGLGNYWRNAHEILLTAWGRGRHSAKPEQVRAMIERASSGPYLEMFARWKAPRWDAWGDQIEETLFTSAAGS